MCFMGLRKLSSIPSSLSIFTKSVLGFVKCFLSLSLCVCVLPIIILM